MTAATEDSVRSVGARAARRPVGRHFAALCVVAAAGTAALYLATHDLPYFSESWTHRVRVEAYASPWEIFDPGQVPFRPLQHALFVLVTSFDLEPWAARIPAFLSYWASVLLVAGIVLRLGGSAFGAGLAAALYLCFPSVKALVYAAAIGNPGRVAFVLLGLFALAGYARAPTRRRGALLVGAQVVALGFHQSGIVLALGCLLLVAARVRGPLALRVRETASRLRDPWLATAVGVALAFALAMACVFPSAYPRSHPLAVVANLARASLALVPEPVRHPAIEGLRGQWGTGGSVFGGIAIAGVAGLGVAGWRRIGPPGRALSGIAVADLVLHAVAVGFVVRYAQLPAALAACVVGLEIDRRPRGRAAALAVVAVVGGAWAYDTAVDVAEYRRAGAIAEQVLDQAAALRRSSARPTPIALVDLPEFYGVERDVPLFGWGTTRALSERGAEGPWRFYHTHEVVGSSEAQPISEAQLERLVAERPYHVLVFDAQREELREYRWLPEARR